MPDTGNARSVRNFWVVRGGSNSTDRVVTTNGNYRLLWDAHADLGVVDYSNMVVRVTIDAHDKVRLWEGGPYWATTNIGAEEPWEYGYFFWWGDTVGYKRENDKWVASDGSNSNFSFVQSYTPTYNKSIATLQSEGWIIHRFQFGGMLSTLSPSCLRNGNDFRPLTGQLTNSQQSGATPRTMCKGLGNGMESGRRPPETLRHKVKPTHPHGPDRLNWEIAETDDMRRDPDDRSPS